ncbi:TPA: RNA-directed DNA polymerase [Enterobacter asburiae]|nr:RNA-directed DNA polymerase [Enterobacter asburiae]HDR2802760.1 RNA-directed DNA polymerase [Enterobacter asburiae]HDR2808189.1 RNA-directed DNA polymerase [Enterobacter asburiae]HDR2813626.1 RNA-directed DNA polymerase [Enterobacter asburiae]
MNKITKRNIIDKILLLDKEQVDEFYQDQIQPSAVIEKRHKRKFLYSLIPDSKLRKIQLNIFSALNEIVELNNSAIAYRSGYSYFDFLEPHSKNYHFLRVDISSFFHSLDTDDIKAAIRHYIEDDIVNDKHKQKLLDVVANCIFYKVPTTSLNKDIHNKTILPMGFCTSPLISNLVFRKIDILVQKLCSKLDITYTRYADDLLFSANRHNKVIHSNYFIKEISILISILGLKLNKNKTLLTSHTISLNGYLIQNQIRLNGFAGLFEPIKPAEIRISNKKTQIIDKLIHHILVKKSDNNIILKKIFNEDVRKIMRFGNKEKYINQYALDQIINKLTGYRSFLISIIKHNTKNNSTSTTTIDKYISKIVKIEKCINILDKRKIYT